VESEPSPESRQEGGLTLKFNINSSELYCLGGGLELCLGWLSPTWRRDWVECLE